VIALNSYGTDECGARLIVVEPLFKLEPPPKKARQESESDLSTESQVTQLAVNQYGQAKQSDEPMDTGGALSEGLHSTAAPKVEQHLRDATLSEKESVEFTTLISGEPKPSARWYINEKVFFLNLALKVAPRLIYSRNEMYRLITAITMFLLNFIKNYYYCRSSKLEKKISGSRNRHPAPAFPSTLYRLPRQRAATPVK
jgi:hypothetical protein